MDKVKFLFLLLAISSITMFTSCEESEENNLGVMDIVPIRFSFYIYDQDSVNILNDSINRALFMERVKVIYKNREYKCTEVIDSLYYSKLWNSENSRALPVFFNGLRIEQLIPTSSKYPYMFTFGDFEATEDHSEISFTIDWGDGATDEIFYSYDFEVKNGNKPVWDYEFYINDELKSEGKGGGYGANHIFVK